MRRLRIKSIAALFSLLALYPALVYFSNPDIYPTHATTHPRNLSAGFYLVLNTRTNDIPGSITHVIEGSKTYVGPMQNIRESHKAHMKIHTKHPGIQTHLIKLDHLNSVN